MQILIHKRLHLKTPAYLKTWSLQMAWWSWDLWRLVMSLHTNEGLNSWTRSFRFQGSSLCCHLIQNYQRGPEGDGPPAPAQELLVHFYSTVIQSVSCMTISVLIKPKRTRTDYSGQVRSARNDLYKLRIRKHSDPSHPGYNLFQFLPFGRCYRAAFHRPLLTCCLY